METKIEKKNPFDWILNVKGVDNNAVREGRLPSLKQLYGNCLRIAWPSTVEGALLSLVNAIDTMMVGVMGSTAIAAVGITSQPRMVLLICAQALCTGVTAVVARRKGADDKESAISCLKQSLIIMLVLAAILTTLGSVFSVPLLKFCGANEEMLPQAVIYFRWICYGLVFNFISMCICAAMRATGQTKITMVTNVTSNLVNMCLNYCLIGGHLGFPALGVEGAAIATFTGGVVSCTIAIIATQRKNTYLRLKIFDKWSFDKNTLSSLFKVGSSSIAESVFLRIGFIINARLIAGIGTVAFAAYNIVMQVTSLSFALGDGIATSGAALVGQSLGAKRPDIAEIYVKICRRLSVIISVFLIVVIFVFRIPIAKLFTTEADVIAGVSSAFITILFGIMPQNGRVIYSGCLRGAGDVKFVAFISLLSVTIMRPILTWVFCYPMALAVEGPWLGFAIDAYFREFLLMRRIKKGEWLTIKL
ncbi:MAG: MATE family efflux transporter [Clostridia bacterium]|nr:MATE family efflux transporter [Clostridia bacterium]